MSKLTLASHPHIHTPTGPLLLVVMDGIGIGDGSASDAVFHARTPVLDHLRALPSATSLFAHGTHVGMPSDKDMGNSEVGHNALGAGRVLSQGAKLVAQAVDDGSLFRGEVWNQALAFAQKNQQALHFLGLLSDGNIHSHIDHLEAMIRAAAERGIEKVRVHILTDGRDVGGRSALGYIERLEACLASCAGPTKDYKIASGGGRMRYTMDRYEADWSMVQRGWDLHVRGQGRAVKSAKEGVQRFYDEDSRDDQWVEGFVVCDGEGPIGRIESGSSVVLFNFRGDRALEISRAFEAQSLDELDRQELPEVFFAGMMQYDGDTQTPANYLVDPPKIDATMGESLAASGKRQLAIAETHKYGHVTYFWNGNKSGAFDPKLERYIEVASEIDDLHERPWMRSAEVTDELIRAASASHYDLIRVNYANGDMIGHTGDLRAATMAVEAVDLALGRLVKWVKAQSGVLVVTADHGNADQMFDEKGGERVVKTSHTLNPVPFAIYDPRSSQGGPRLQQDPSAGIGSVAATCLELMGLRAPELMMPSLLDSSNFD